MQKNIVEEYRIGLDIGAESVGWAALSDVNNEILDMGVRIFSAAENSKTGESLAKPRREARSARRRNRRRAHRKERIRRLFIRSGLLTQEECEQLFPQEPSEAFAESPWELRVKSLDGILKSDELARVLYHIANRRGFKSNRKKAPSNSEEGELLAAVGENQKLLNEKGYRTVAEMFIKDEKFKEHKRNRCGVYSCTVNRDELENEIEEIFKSQQKLGFLFKQNPALSLDELKKEYLNIMLSQRDFSEGPGAGSPYGGDLIEKMRGFCTFEKEKEKRCAKACFSFEKFTALQKLVNTKLFSAESGELSLTPEQIQSLFSESMQKNKLTYKQARKLLNLDDSVYFKHLNYAQKFGDEAKEDNKSKNPEDTALIELKAFHEIRKEVEREIGKDYWKQKAKSEDFKDWLDIIGEVFSLYKTEDNIRNALTKENFSEEEINALSGLSFSKFGHLSIKALRNINPFLEQGNKYNDACELAGYDFKAHANDKKEELLRKIPVENLTNPVVIRALCQARKVINAIIRKYGSPISIYIETARDLEKSRDKKNEIQRVINKNQESNQKAKEYIEKEFKISAKKDDIIKYRLYQEQNCKCLYSLEAIDLKRLFEHGYVEIDHILPYSRTFNDSYNNKVLVLTSSNRDKCNRTPYEWLIKSNPQKWEQVEAYIKSCKTIPTVKKNNLLKKKLTKEDIIEIQNRSLNDTRYINVFLKNFIEDNLELAESPGKKKVYSVNGAVTAYLRYRWGIHKDREESVKHHAADAVVVACITGAMIQQISIASKYNEFYNKKVDIGYIDPDTGEVLEGQYKSSMEKKHFPSPMPDFRTKLSEKLQALFVSRMPRHKATGAAHAETIRSLKEFNEDDEKAYTIIRKSIESIKQTELKDLCCKKDDPQLFNEIKLRLERDGKIIPPLYKMKKDGSQGPEVRHLKVKSTKDITGIVVNKGLAKNGNMIRLDVFRKDGKNHFVPIYSSDTVKDELPAKIEPPSKEHSRIDDSYEFLFSLRYNDLIKIIGKDDEYLGYYIGYDRKNGTITYAKHDASLKPTEKGGKRKGEEEKGGKQVKIEKYQVDILGNYTKISNEKRMGFKPKKQNT